MEPVLRRVTLLMAVAVCGCTTSKALPGSEIPDASVTAPDAGPDVDAGLQEPDAGHEGIHFDWGPGDGLPLGTDRVLDLGKVKVGVRFELAFNVHNATGQPVSITSVAFDGDSHFDGDSFGVATPLAPGEVRSLSVGFRADEAGRHEATLTLGLSSADVPSLEVFLIATAVDRCHGLPTELDLGTVGVGCANTQTIRLGNDCRSPVTIESIALAAGSSARFSIVNTTPLPVVIDRYGWGTTLEMTLRYSPTVEAPNGETAELEIVESGTTLRLPLRGIGSGSPMQTDSFHPPSRPKRDILFVIDDSPAMAGHEAEVQSALERFAQYASGVWADYHVAITTTSVGGSGDANGRFIPLTEGDPRVLSNAAPDFQQALLRLAEVGTAGNPAPMLLRPVYLALSDPLLHRHNAGFLRTDATLIVFVISNSDDHDDTLLSTYESFLLRLKPNRYPLDARFAAAVPLVAVGQRCGTGTFDPNSVPRAALLAIRSGGLVEDFCGSSWDRVLSRLEGYSEGYLVPVIPLSQVPDMTVTDPIRVAMDGVAVPQFDASGDAVWYLRTEETTVYWDPMVSMPDPESYSIVTATYRPVCQAR